MEDNIIQLFSGTGNTLYVAKKIAEKLDKSLIIPFKTGDNIKCNHYILLFPVYAYTIPKVVKDYLKQTDIQASKISVIVTYGSTVGAVFQDIKKLFHKKGLVVTYFNKVKCPENFQELFPVNLKKNAITLANIPNKVELIAKDIQNSTSNKPTHSSILTYLVSRFFLAFSNTLFLKNHIRKKRCTKCKLCMKICPMKAIYFTNKIKFNNKLCTYCQRCINLCPAKAIHMLGEMTQEKYINKNISIDELTKS
jgi:ferredoxin